VKTVLIIGATSAIAQAIARKLAQSMETMVLWGRSDAKLALIVQDVQARSSVKVQTKAFDFNDLKSQESAFNELRTTTDELDVAVVCHGTLGDQAAGEGDFGVALQELNTNCISALSFLTLLANYFERQKRGCIVVLSSVAGDRGRQSNYIYGTAKAAVSTFLQGLRNRLYRSGVHVVTVKPGFVDTPMTAHMEKNLLFASPEKIADDVVRAIHRKQCVVYTPWFWRYIMLIVRLIPERIFRHLKL
jgi:short-subunit dehydrogenase